MSLILEVEDVLSKLDMPCLGKSFCEIGFNFKVNPDDESSIDAQESIRYLILKLYTYLLIQELDRYAIFLFC